MSASLSLAKEKKEQVFSTNIYWAITKISGIKCSLLKIKSSKLSDFMLKTRTNIISTNGVRKITRFPFKFSLLF